jgi:hypothetical protein
MFVDLFCIYPVNVPIEFNISIITTVLLQSSGLAVTTALYVPQNSIFRVNCHILYVASTNIFCLSLFYMYDCTHSSS